MSRFSALPWFVLMIKCLGFERVSVRSEGWCSFAASIWLNCALIFKTSLFFSFIPILWIGIHRLRNDSSFTEIWITILYSLWLCTTTVIHLYVYTWNVSTFIKSFRRKLSAIMKKKNVESSHHISTWILPVLALPYLWTAFREHNILSFSSTVLFIIHHFFIAFLLTTFNWSLLEVSSTLRTSSLHHTKEFSKCIETSPIGQELNSFKWPFLGQMKKVLDDLERDITRLQDLGEGLFSFFRIPVCLTLCLDVCYATAGIMAYYSNSKLSEQPLMYFVHGGIMIIFSTLVSDLIHIQAQKSKKAFERSVSKLFYKDKGREFGDFPTSTFLEMKIKSVGQKFDEFPRLDFIGIFMVGRHCLVPIFCNFFTFLIIGVQLREPTPSASN